MQKCRNYWISTKGIVPPNLDRKFLVRHEISENLDIPCEVDLMFVNSGKCCSIRKLKFLEIQPRIFHRMNWVPLVSVWRVLFNCFPNYHLLILITNGLPTPKKGRSSGSGFTAILNFRKFDIWQKITYVSSRLRRMMTNGREWYVGGLGDNHRFTSVQVTNFLSCNSWWGTEKNPRRISASNLTFVCN